MTQITENVRLAFEDAQQNRELADETVDACSKALRSLRNNHLRRAKTSSAKQGILNQIALVKGYKEQLNDLRRPAGAGLSQTKGRESRLSTRIKWVDAESAFGGRLRTGLIMSLRHKDPKNFLEDCNEVFQRKIKKALDNEMAIKVNAVFCGEFHVIKGGDELHEQKFMNTKNAPIYRETDLNTWFKEHVQDEILKKLEEFQKRDSGWALVAITNLAVNINKFTPQLGSSYVPLPKQIETKKACINIKNDDNACFAWAIISALHPAGANSDRTSSYPDYRGKLNLNNIQFPMMIRQIPRFEKQNNISVNVYVLLKSINAYTGLHTYTVLPTYLTKDKKEQHVNLLMIQDVYPEEDKEEDEGDDADGNDKPIKYHYVWIKNLSRLLSSQVSSHLGAKYFCDRCLHYYYSATKLKIHAEDCGKMNNCKIRMPTEAEKMLSFKNFKNKVLAPFVVYADLECLLVEPASEKESMSTNLKYLSVEPTSQKKSKSKKTTTYQKHIPHSAGYYVKCAYDPTLSFYKSYRGADCIEWFVSELEQFAEDVETVFLCPYDMGGLTSDQNRDFGLASTCHICEKSFSDDAIKVRDHCHLTGKYRGAAHEGCNINFKDTHTVPIIFHNLSGYDSHFIIKNIARDLKGRVDLLPINKERYISFTKRLDEYLIKFRFIDSFKFMNSSLDALVSSVTTFPLLKTEFSSLNETQFNLLTRKGVFPYDYCNDISKFDETSLPDIAHFYNKLNDYMISDMDYEHAKKVWQDFNLENLGEYSDLYLKSDVLLLADVFEQFRSSCHKTYGLDPAHYFTLPGYTWDAMLKYTDITLELLTDVDMLMFVERGIRGGLSQCSKRYSKANNKYMPDFKPTQPSKYLMYYDINNQYGWAMSQYLPHSDFNWVEDVRSFNVEDISNDSNIGYILEVDLEYPDDLHDQHKDLPFCPEHLAPPDSKQQKLMGTLFNKTKYIIHYRGLIQALKYGLKLNKIHRILQFKQCQWLKPYIDLNTRLRTAAMSKFEQDLFKLMNNAVFGKTMENIRKHSIVKLVTKWLGRYGAEAYIAKPEFRASSIFEEGLVAIELNKTEIFFNKPIYVGMCILDLSKTTLYDFHYGYMVPQFKDDCAVCYTDTDSLIYEVCCSDLYESIGQDAPKYFDTSNYSNINPYNIPNTFNKKVLGVMKDENGGRIMTEFAGLRSKMYAVRVEGEDDDDKRKAKGVKKGVVKKSISFNDYVVCLNSGENMKVKQNLIQSRKHVVSSITQEKIALNPHDDKRFLLGADYKTLPWGHYSIMDYSTN